MEKFELALTSGFLLMTLLVLPLVCGRSLETSQIGLLADTASPLPRENDTIVATDMVKSDTNAANVATENDTTVATDVVENDTTVATGVVENDTTGTTDVGQNDTTTIVGEKLDKNAPAPEQLEEPTEQVAENTTSCTLKEPVKPIEKNTTSVPEEYREPKEKNITVYELCVDQVIDPSLTHFSLVSPKFGREGYQRFERCSLTYGDTAVPLVLRMNFRVFDIAGHVTCGSGLVRINYAILCDSWPMGKELDFLVKPAGQFYLFFDSKYGQLVPTTDGSSLLVTGSPWNWILALSTVSTLIWRVTLSEVLSQRR
ncbi:uncharacterized protein LOC101853628 isoform X2 [Aplysia californica]|uniref:Uncharacterized protein LOC101853628 isoform X2 n=1 Tax=Aplysia californica TaxID=6500 RepID=A0ABM0JUD4_APLCA|nr:uncharacterized protein LOC101853628 isoform X2 [Aplysia californica]